MTSTVPRVPSTEQQSAQFLGQPKLLFDRGFADHGERFYKRLNLRDWLDCLDWLFAESRDREALLKPWQIDDFDLELNIQAMLADEIAEADQEYARLAALVLQ